MEPATIAVLVMTAGAAALVGWLAVNSHRQAQKTDKPEPPVTPEGTAPPANRKIKKG